MGPVKGGRNHILKSWMFSLEAWMILLNLKNVNEGNDKAFFVFKFIL
jgi:hypothetical protein